MDSPSSGSAPPHPLAERDSPARPRPGQPPAPTILVAGLGHAVAADYSAFAGQGGRGRAILLDGAAGSTPERADALIVFVGDRLDDARRRALADLPGTLRDGSIRFVGVVGSFRVHLGDRRAEAAEREALDLLGAGAPGRRVAIFRPGHLLGGRGGIDRTLTRLAPLATLVPARLTSCVLEASELFAAIEAERQPRDEGGAETRTGRRPDDRCRAFTLLGENAPVREILRRHRRRSAFGSVVAALATVLAWLQVGQLAGLVVSLLARRSARFRAWHIGTLEPRSFAELLSLCHAGNIDRVKVVGYNNGVNHFGHRHPGRTVASTARLDRTALVRPGRLKADAGATIRDALDCLAARGEELYVAPNYSYVSLGTSFFVPIHGSAVDYATVADTITRVVLYDPDRDRIVAADRGEPDFDDNISNLRSRVVLLRAYLLSKPKSRYYVRREVATDADADALLAALRDREAANVEIRQGNAASPTVTISRYYTDPGDAGSAALELPRDALGRLWDQLEENPVTSFLMHATSRHVAWHTELFLTPAEFEIFWRTHASVPLRKIQLRYIRRDGMPHSPFRDEDCVSADLFLFRTDKPRFDAYIAAHLPKVRTNPGKHSH